MEELEEQTKIVEFTLEPKPEDIAEQLSDYHYWWA